jgi:hypothetical protein
MMCVEVHSTAAKDLHHGRTHLPVPSVQQDSKFMSLGRK